MKRNNTHTGQWLNARHKGTMMIYDILYTGRSQKKKKKKGIKRQAPFKTPNG
jgi:hypothetical protein